jgi:broad specificity phosphatase PhoE
MWDARSRGGVTDGAGDSCGLRRLFLVRHAPTAATRSHAFPADEPLDDRALTAAAELALPARAEAVCSPARRCRETALAAGLAVDSLEPAISECDFGSWGGRRLEELVAECPDDTRLWMTDPDSAPHGGESLREFAARLSGWLDDQAGRDGTCVAITHGGVVKAAVVHALGAPIEAFWAVDSAPLSRTELHADRGRWRLTNVNVRISAARALPVEEEVAL